MPCLPASPDRSAPQSSLAPQSSRAPQPSRAPQSRWAPKPPALASSAAALLGLTLASAAPSAAHAKDLGGKFGLGFNNYLGGGPAIAVRYGIPTGDNPFNIIVEGNTGFSSYSGTDSAFTAGGRLLFSTVVEDNMNFYVGAGAGYVKKGEVEVVRLQPLASIDFFLFGLDNLGFTTAFGIDLDVGGDPTGIATSTAALAGVTYWF